MEFLLGALVSAVSFLLGFSLSFLIKKNGVYDISPPAWGDNFDIGRNHTKKLGSSIGVGAVHRPTPQDIAEKTNPHDIAKKQEREAMQELLAPIFDRP